MKAYFNANPVEAILVGGPGLTKQDFIDNYIDPGLKAKIIYVADTGNGGDLGIRDLIQKASGDNILEKNELMKEKRVVSSFIERVSRGDQLVEYGKKEVTAALDEGRVDQLLVSEGLDPCCIDDLSSRALETGASVVVISTSSEEGEMFAAGFTGIGAILRWASRAQSRCIAPFRQ